MIKTALSFFVIFFQISFADSKVELLHLLKMNDLKNHPGHEEIISHFHHDKDEFTLKTSIVSYLIENPNDEHFLTLYEKTFGKLTPAQRKSILTFADLVNNPHKKQFSVEETIWAYRFFKSTFKLDSFELGDWIDKLFVNSLLLCKDSLSSTNRRFILAALIRDLYREVPALRTQHIFNWNLWLKILSKEHFFKKFQTDFLVNYHQSSNLFFHLKGRAYDPRIDLALYVDPISTEILLPSIEDLTELSISNSINYLYAESILDSLIIQIDSGHNIASTLRLLANLKSINPKKKDVILNSIVNRMKQTVQNDQLIIQALKALQHLHPHDPNILIYMITFLGDNNPKIREQVAEALLNLNIPFSEIYREIKIKITENHQLYLLDDVAQSSLKLINKINEFDNNNISIPNKVFDWCHRNIFYFFKK
jgi:hypothetical protein